MVVFAVALLVNDGSHLPCLDVLGYSGTVGAISLIHLAQNMRQHTNYSTLMLKHLRVVHYSLLAVVRYVRSVDDWHSWSDLEVEVDHNHDNPQQTQNAGSYHGLHCRAVAAGHFSQDHMS